MYLNTDHFARRIKTLESNPVDLGKPQPDLSQLKEALRDSNLPILVDVLDWALIPESFRAEILRGGHVLIREICSKREKAGNGVG